MEREEFLTKEMLRNKEKNKLKEEIKRLKNLEVNIENVDIDNKIKEIKEEKKRNSGKRRKKLRKKKSRSKNSLIEIEKLKKLLLEKKRFLLK